MKIAVTYENGEIFQHFGHTEHAHGEKEHTRKNHGCHGHGEE